MLKNKKVSLRVTLCEQNLFERFREEMSEVAENLKVGKSDSS